MSHNGAVDAVFEPPPDDWRRWRTPAGGRSEYPGATFASAPSSVVMTEEATSSVQRIGETADEPRIVVGADGSPGSLRAVDWAAEEARLRGARLVVVHANLWIHDALTAPGFEEQAELEAEILRTAIGRVRSRYPDVTVEGRATEPPAAASLVREGAGAVMLVVGSRGLGRFEELLVGSVSQQCVSHARCPVVVVRDGDTGDRPTNMS